MKILANVARILLGGVFIFSGFVKGVDPLGSTYKFLDYFTAFHLTSLSPAVFVLAILQNTGETLIGIALVWRLRMKVAAWAALLFMLFYTTLTFILALTNPVTDCGCFGDALILTNWQTFFKNLVLMVLAITVFIRRNKFLPVYRPAAEWLCVIAAAAVITGISLYCYRHLPLFDFRPYSVGVNIPQNMTVPEGMPADEFETTLYYEKDGVVKAFSEQDYPWNDSTWTWKDTRSVLLKKGYQPPIHDFSVVTAEHGADITEELLSDESYTFLLVAYRLNESNRKALQQANEIAQFCRNNNYGFYCLTSSLQDEIHSVKSQLGLSYEFCFTDAITLKTIIRANPGLLLLKKGTILAKWHFNDMPDAQELTGDLTGYALKKQSDTSDKRLFYLLLTLLVLARCALFGFRKKRRHRFRNN
ncbi:MAG: DoxX family protein [Bacteroidales bacterium]|jgi:uncharacterized membrane protein YphA (DoxX/SURF4 family)|nr:DoxX family protein [Bacteroidales bacterium]